MSWIKKLFSVFLVFVLCFSLCACSGAGLNKYSKSTTQLFDTYCEITAYDTSQASFDKKYEKIYALLEKYDQLFDIYHTYDFVVNLKYVNDHAASSPVAVSDEIMDLLLYGKKVYDLSEKTVNIAMGSVLSLWHEKREEGRQLPDMAELQRRRKHTNINSLVLDEDKKTVFFSDPALSLDVGALAKGFVCEKIAEYIVQNQLFDSALISLGGNIKTVGTKGNRADEAFNVAVENPLSQDYLAVLNVSSGDSVVTSGDYQRYYEVNGKRYCHIINPKTLMPSEFVSSVTVVAKDSLYADAMSTALFNMSIDDGLKLVNSTELLEAVWLSPDGTITYSDNFKDYLK